MGMHMTPLEDIRAAWYSARPDPGRPIGPNDHQLIVAYARRRYRTTYEDASDTQIVNLVLQSDLFPTTKTPKWR